MHGIGDSSATLGGGSAAGPRPAPSAIALTRFGTAHAARRLLAVAYANGSVTRLVCWVMPRRRWSATARRRRRDAARHQYPDRTERFVLVGTAAGRVVTPLLRAASLPGSRRCSRHCSCRRCAGRPDSLSRRCGCWSLGRGRGGPAAAVRPCPRRHRARCAGSDAARGRRLAWAGRPALDRCYHARDADAAGGAGGTLSSSRRARTAHRAMPGSRLRSLG
ncbi:hypothetical protein HBB16_11225 [Pseudonocardia sp. MCCB 268]|nr:hypothetical protein [Pseudonocardia cytotoxica]